MKLWWKYYNEEFNKLKNNPIKYQSIKFQEWLKNKNKLV